MGWIEKKPLSNDHVCDKPKIRRFTEEIGPGSLWECDECGARWMLVEGTAGPPVWIYAQQSTRTPKRARPAREGNPT